MSDPSRDSRKRNEHDGRSSTSRNNSNDDNSNDPHRLTSLLPSTGRGGLMKPPSSAASASIATSASSTSGGAAGGGTQSQSQQPRASLLGLDQLAASKRKDNAEISGSSKPKAAAAAAAQGRQYRRSNETPVAPSQQHQQHPVDVRRNQRRDHPYQPASERRRTGGHGSSSYSDDQRRGGNGNDYDSHDRRDNRRSRPGESDASGGGSSYYQPGGGREGQHDPSGSNRRSSRDPNRSSRRDDPDDSYRRSRDHSQQSSNRRDGDHRNNNDSYRDGPGRRRGSETNTDNRRQPQVTPSTTASRNDSSQFRSYRQQERGGSGNGGRGRRLEDAPTPGRQSSYQQQQQQRLPSSQRHGSSNNAWEVETPAPLPRDNVDAALIEPLETADEDFDRDFYLQEDEGHAIQDATNDNDLGRFLYTNAKIEARQEAMDRQQKDGQKNPRQNARQSALNHDQQAWEENRLLSAGAAVQGTVDLDHVTEQDTSVTLLVHQVKPPFLDGRVSFSTIREAVPTVRDASSDFAKMAREGSVTLRTLRANKDKNAMRQKFWELGGTHMGNVMGIKEGDNAGDGTGDKSAKDGSTNDDRPAEETADGEIDYKKSTGFKDHVKNKDGDGPVSEFAKSKTIRQQREFLPAFGVREELLNIIRENNVVIIVGATGSGAFSDDGAGGKRFPVTCAAHSLQV
jgi:pre-mRNA-splicing factor ATP-dependent RNA helicase DHX38/PRP16